MNLRAALPRDLSSLLRALASADTLFFLMPAIMLLLVAGTLAQRSMGLYTAQKIFFASFIIWAGPLPLPGGYTLLALLTFCLVVKFFFFSTWNWRKSGIILAHLGALTLLIGGLAAALSAREGFMIIPENGETPYVYDYQQRELFVFRDDLLEQAVPFEKLGTAKPGSLPLRINIINTCRNCEIVKREDIPDETGDRQTHDLAQFMALKDKPEETEPEENIAGVTFTLEGLSDEHDGLYIAFEGMPKPIELTIKDRNYKIIFGRQQRLLPFSLRLKDFVKEDYPGTNKARGYHADILVVDGTISWPARIEMNKPLRYKGYTFYQSSFDIAEDENGRQETTILTVVENKGRLFPYIGTGLLAAGLLLHLLITVRSRRDA